ncbi:cathelin-related peptide SC5-like [Mantella aurantiaca]
MRSGWHCVLWLYAAVSLARSLDQDGWIGEALDLYNQRENGEFYFKLLSDLQAPPMEDAEDSPTVAFLIKETECPKSEELDPIQCGYKKDGEVKVCGIYSEEEISLKCVSVTQNSRVKRSNGKKKCKDLLCRILTSPPGSRTVLRIKPTQSIFWHHLSAPPPIPTMPLITP